MFEWTEQMFKLSPTWQARGERRAARRLKLLWFNREPKINEKLKKVISSGDISRVVKAYHAQAKIDRQEMNYAFLIIKKMRVVIYKQLDSLKNISEAIWKDATLTEEEKSALRVKINSEIGLVQNVNNALLNGENNIAHEGRTLSIREALDQGSLLNDFYFLSRNEIRRVRRTTRDEKQLLSALVKSSDNEKVEKIMRHLESDLKAETDNELKEATDALIVLNDIEKKIKAHEASISQLMVKEGFPEETGKKIAQEFEEAEDWMKKQAKLDLGKERFAESKAIRSELKAHQPT
jgi:hypothetical protein